TRTHTHTKGRWLRQLHTHTCHLHAGPPSPAAPWDSVTAIGRWNGEPSLENSATCYKTRFPARAVPFLSYAEVEYPPPRRHFICLRTRTLSTCVLHGMGAWR
ncbi:unnamed protein product, partial [Ectocarpus sp. 13 AM-2016]